ncbi:aminodeoxychorismate synthase component I [Phaeospirillum tilakii]|uniref:aminodeoxychorismate synthase n=1 Tax=Phaeospirillum tilakii TaxID=741673 RepID=A0ABW5CB97_9PROT
MWQEIPYVDPLRAYAPWAGEAWAMLLDSGGDDTARGRHAFLAVRPVHTLTADGAGLRRDGVAIGGDPFAALAEALAAFPPPPPGPLPFAGGAVGLFGYELGRHLERAPARHGSGPAELAVGLYDAVAGFDRVARRAWVVAARPQARAKAAALAEAIAAAPPLPPLPPPPGLALRPELTREAYLDRVRRILALIAAGEVYQVNYTQRFRAARPAGLDPFALYRRLRALNPAPFAACLRFGGGLALVSASPERFLSLDRAGRIEARPIKGTRPRAADPAADRAAAAALAASGKDQAENLMITDLLRNDIGRVARLGSVRVPVLRGIESHATVHHLVSVVEGRLRPGLGPVDLLRAAFPGGSITGAPKLRAMEIIDDLEPGPRGPYCGAVGWIGGDGAMDTSIVIRAITLTADEVIAQAGGGIVAESDPAAEHAEMMTKLAPALAALEGEGRC